jgi:hypothetical protein
MRPSHTSCDSHQSEADHFTKRRRAMSDSGLRLFVISPEIHILV